LYILSFGKALVLKIGLGPCFEKIKQLENKRRHQVTLFGEKVRSASEGMITRTPGCVGPHTYSSIQTLQPRFFTTIWANIQETLFYLSTGKKFLLALIFGLLDTTQTWLEKLGCYII
jgi:hypothetical protein